MILAHVATHDFHQWEKLSFQSCLFKTVNKKQQQYKDVQTENVNNYYNFTITSVFLEGQSWLIQEPLTKN